MPVLELVRQKDVSPDTIISPVERISQQQQIRTPASPLVHMKTESASASPFSMPSVPVYPTSQAIGNGGQSYYANQQHYVNAPTSSYDPHAQIQQQAQNVRAPVTGYDVMSYPAPSYQGQQPHQFVPINNPGASTYPPPFNAVSRQVQQQLRTPASSYGVHVTPVSNPTYEAQQQQQHQQQMYSSPVEGMPFLNQFNQASTLPEHIPMGLHYQNTAMGAAPGAQYQQSPDQQPSGYARASGTPDYPFQQ